MGLLFCSKILCVSDLFDSNNQKQTNKQTNASRWNQYNQLDQLRWNQHINAGLRRSSYKPGLRVYLLVRTGFGQTLSTTQPEAFTARRARETACERHVRQQEAARTHLSSEHSKLHEEPAPTSFSRTGGVLFWNPETRAALAALWVTSRRWQSEIVYAADESLCCKCGESNLRDLFSDYCSFCYSSRCSFYCLYIFWYFLILVYKIRCLSHF